MSNQASASRLDCQYCKVEKIVRHACHWCQSGISYRVGQYALAARHCQRGEAHANVVGELKVADCAAGALLNDDGGPAWCG